MEKYINYVREFHENNEQGLFFVKNQLKKHLETNEENQTEIETMLDYLYSNQSVDISQIWYKTILQKTNKRHKKLQSVATKDQEVEWEDYEVYHDYWDWFKIVKLKSKESYEREGKLMSHCVASYYGRDTTVYSLRDEKNKPHCTIEDWQQIKGKGNWSIDPKYIDYVVQFLSKKWMTVGENEMKNLWYYKLDSIDQWLECEDAYNWYIHEKNIDKITKDWEQYLWYWLFKIKSLLEIKSDFSIKRNFDLSKMIQRVLKKTQWLSAVANNDHSTAVANSSYSTAVANSSYSTAVANHTHSTAVVNSYSSTAVANHTHSTAVANHTYSTAVANDSHSTAVANIHSSTAVVNDSYSTAVANHTYSTAVANNHHSTAVANGINSIAVTRSYKSKAQWRIGAWLVIAERDESKWEIINILTTKVDWDKIKQDTPYTAIDWQIVEYNLTITTN